MAGTDYSTYLKIPDLLTLQVPLTSGADDELLFIVVHQSYELWFKVIIDEVRKATLALWDKTPWLAMRPLRRLVEVEDLLLNHLRVLETMSPEKFLEFRDPLDPASGFQSYQFRAIEFLSGSGRRDLLTSGLFTGDVVAWLESVSEEPSLLGGFEHSLRHYRGATGLAVSFDQLCVDLYRRHLDATGASLHTVAELMLDHDERLAMWRHQHVLMAGRQIGRRPGTGGSAGMAYLETTLAQRLYPALWNVRSNL